MLSSVGIIANGLVDGPVAEAHLGGVEGSFDRLTVDLEHGRVFLEGWALSTIHGTTPLGVRVLIDGQVHPMPSPGFVTANLTRADLAPHYPCCGVDHGFAFWVTAPLGVHTMCLQAQTHGTYYNFGPCRTYDMTFDPMMPTSSISGCTDTHLWGGNRIPCQTDNRYTSRCVDTTYQPFTTKAATGVNATLNNSYNTTVLDTTPYDTSCVYSGSGETDIVLRELSNLPNNAWGTYFCDDAVSSTRCDQGYVQFDKEVIAASTFTPEEMWKLACHEIGHAVGLVHGNNADPSIDAHSATNRCMVKGNYNNSSTDRWLGSNNANWINATY